jgi:hypothetical protein
MVAYQCASHEEPRGRIDTVQSRASVAGAPATRETGIGLRSGLVHRAALGLSPVRRVGRDGGNVLPGCPFEGRVGQDLRRQTSMRVMQGDRQEQTVREEIRIAVGQEARPPGCWNAARRYCLRPVLPGDRSSAVSCLDFR